MEIWELISGPEAWSSNYDALTRSGRVVLPHSRLAIRFSLIGGLRRCYLNPNELWNPVFEDRRSSLIHAMSFDIQELRKILKRINVTTVKAIQLGELNRIVEYEFIERTLQQMGKEA